jgi:Flp pilus assembly protein TadD
MTLAQVLALAEQHRQSGRLDAAERLCSEVLRVTPDQAETMQTLGIIVYQSGRAAEGIDLVRKAIAARRTSHCFTRIYASCCGALGGSTRRWLPGGRQLRLTRISRKPTTIWASYISSGRNTPRRRNAIDAPSRLSPGLAEVRSNFGNALQALGKSDEAVEAYRQAIALKPEYAEGHNNLATALRLMRRYGDAETHCRWALALSQQHPGILNNLALCLVPQRRLDEALSLLSRSADLDADNTQTLVLLASLLSKCNEHDKAKAACERSHRQPCKAPWRAW